MNKIPTAEEILNKTHWDGIQNHELDQSKVEEAMIEFAKLHVKAALEAAANDISEGPSDAMEEGILNAYPESNIK